jgi:hypothetical protein
VTIEQPEGNCRSVKRLTVARRVFWVVFAAIWAVSLFAGFRMLWAYEDAPGVDGRPAQSWPGQSSLQMAPDTPTLVMVAHPLCPCTRASLAELSKLMTSSRGRLSAYVIVAGSRIAPEPEKTETFSRASAIPGVRAIGDADGGELRLFPAATSGQVFVYDEEGRLRFSGGITAARGHQGPNRGAQAIASLVNRRRIERVTTRVFGCLIGNKDGEGK